MACMLWLGLSGRNRNDDPADVRWINSDLIGFTDSMKNIKAETAQRRVFFQTVYYISAGQTSLPQVQWEYIIHWDVFLCSILPEIRKCNS